MRAKLEQLLTWVLGIALVASILATGYVAVNPPETTDPYTEFYVLGPSGNASGYPSNLTVGESGAFVVGLTNHEHEQTTYTVVAATENRTVWEETVTVADEETWEQRVTYEPQSPGQKRLRLLLYRGDSAGDPADPYRHLRLWIDVKAA